VGAARFNAFNWACAKNVLLQARWEKAECVINYIVIGEVAVGEDKSWWKAREL
jgi:hypothetical protein